MSSTKTPPGNDRIGLAEIHRISDRHFHAIRELMAEQVGIVLQDKKKALVESRMNRRLRTLGISDYGEYLEYLRADKSGQELILLIDAISTNVTHFFREQDHFEFLHASATRWLAEGRDKLRFWSAACSSGEEPYSLAMTLKSLPAAGGADIRILASDISTHILRRAVQGSYLAESVFTIPRSMADRFLQRSSSDAGDVYRVSDELRNMVVFRRLNLNRTPYPIRGVFDAIMCRNVMIYFDNELRSRIVGEAFRLLRPGGYLLIGHAETLVGIESRFEFERPAVYRRL